MSRQGVGADVGLVEVQPGLGVPMKTDWGRVADYALGTCETPCALAERFEVPEEELEEQLLELNVETCPECGWWVDSGEMVETEDAAMVCEECGANG